MEITSDGKTYDCYLGDDGTMDTVIVIDGREFRYSDTSHLRDEAGALTDEGFYELCHECIDDLWQYEE